MKADDMFDGVTDIRDDLIGGAGKARKGGGRKWWLGAVAAVLKSRRSPSSSPSSHTLMTRASCRRSTCSSTVPGAGTQSSSSEIVRSCGLAGG